jgi:hypothetical protein
MKMIFVVLLAMAGNAFAYCDGRLSSGAYSACISQEQQVRQLISAEQAQARAMDEQTMLMQQQQNRVNTYRSYGGGNNDMIPMMGAPNNIGNNVMRSFMMGRMMAQ